MSRRIRPSLLAAVVCGAFAMPSLAQFNAQQSQVRGMNERFRLDLGGFFQKLDTTIQLGGSNGGAGTEVNLEDVLGQDARQTTFRADGYWRFGPHGRLDFGYRGWNRQSDRVLSQDITVGDQTYHVGANIDTHMQVNVADLFYSYSFANNGETELGLSLGASVYRTKFEAEVMATLSGGGGTASGSTTAESRDVIAPIPALGAYFTFTLLPRFFFYAKAKGITGAASGYHAEMLDAKVGLDYYFGQNVGIGAGYNYVTITVQHDETREFRINYKYSGPLAYLSLAF
jgi:hypothetical protein